MIQVISFLGSLTLLWLAARGVVKHLARLGAALRFSKFAMGTLIMAFATTTPELLVGIGAAMNQEPLLSIGNVFGTGMVNLGLILGAALLINKKMILLEPSTWQPLLWGTSIALLPLLLGIDGHLSRLDGLLALSVGVCWFIYLARKQQESQAVLQEGPPVWGCLTAALGFIGALVVLLVSAHWTVGSALAVAAEFAVPTFVIGIIGLAIGTSLPELALTLRTVNTPQITIALGNLVGATVITATLVFGITILITPTDMQFLDLVRPGMGLLALLGTFFLTKRKLNRLTGIICISIWLVFTIMEMRSI